MNTTATFQCETAEVRVTPIGKFQEDRMPHAFKVQVIPASILLPTDTIQVNEPYYFLAAAEALDQYKEKYGLDNSKIWTLNN